MMSAVPVLAAAIFAGASLGGGLYETLLIDAAWPRKLEIIQPARGGIDRKHFWMPMHFALEAALGVSLWAVWHRGEARTWVIVALAAHLVMRAWSFAWFIPRALRFERAEGASPALMGEARDWVSKSRLRLLLDLAVTVSLCVALLTLAQASSLSH